MRFSSNMAMPFGGGNTKQRINKMHQMQEEVEAKMWKDKTTVEVFMNHLTDDSV
jgi:hypothetical protein